MLPTTIAPQHLPSWNGMLDAKWIVDQHEKRWLGAIRPSPSPLHDWHSDFLRLLSRSNFAMCKFDIYFSEKNVGPPESSHIGSQGQSTGTLKRRSMFRDFRPWPAPFGLRQKRAHVTSALTKHINTTLRPHRRRRNVNYRQRNRLSQYNADLRVKLIRKAMRDRELLGKANFNGKSQRANYGRVAPRESTNTRALKRERQHRK